jgi:hypothetical protein
MPGSFCCEWQRFWLVASTPVSNRDTADLFCLVGVRMNWPKERALAGMLALVCIWMTLFGPASELQTYVLLARRAEVFAPPNLGNFHALSSSTRLLKNLLSTSFCASTKARL